MPCDEFTSIECIVTGCPKLKVLHLLWENSTESARCLLLGLPNLIEFRHSSMVFALEQIIKDGKFEAVSALRNLYIDDERDIFNFGDIEDYESGRILKSAQVVMNHLRSITKLDIDVSPSTCCKKQAGLYESISKFTYLTNLTLNNFSSYTHALVPAIEAVGHQLRLLDFSCKCFHDLHYISDAIDQCRELRKLRVIIQVWGDDPYLDTSYGDYGDDLAEEFTPFCYLDELLLEGLNQSYLKPALFKSLIASPRLKKLTLLEVPNFTDHVLQAAFNHTNDEGEQLAFTSLRKLSVENCDFVANYLESVVTDEEVPLEYLEVNDCHNVRDIELWNLERFQMKVVIDYENLF